MSIGAVETSDWISVRYSRATGWVCATLLVLGLAPGAGLVSLGVWILVALAPRPGRPLIPTIGIVVLAAACVTSGLAIPLTFLSLRRRIVASLRAEVGLWTDERGIHGRFGYRLTPICVPWEDVGRIEIIEIRVSQNNIALLAIEYRDPLTWESGLPRWVRWRRRFVFRRTGMVPVLTWEASFGTPPLDALRDELVREWLRETSHNAGRASEAYMDGEPDQRSHPLASSAS
jgi:hypothetical protein